MRKFSLVLMCFLFGCVSAQRGSPTSDRKARVNFDPRFVLEVWTYNHLEETAKPEVSHYPLTLFATSVLLEDGGPERTYEFNDLSSKTFLVDYEKSPNGDWLPVYERIDIGLKITLNQSDEGTQLDDEVYYDISIYHCVFTGNRDITVNGGLIIQLPTSSIHKLETTFSFPEELQKISEEPEEISGWRAKLGLPDTKNRLWLGGLLDGGEHSTGTNATRTKMSTAYCVVKKY